MRVLVMTNNKGGVGKTTVCVHLAFYLAEKGNRVLYVDSDPQANSTSTLRRYVVPGITADQVFTGPTPRPFGCVADNLALLAARVDALKAIDRMPAEQVFRTVQAFFDHVDEAFDICLVDTSPSFEVRTLAAIANSDYVLSPMRLDNYSVDGVATVLRAVFGIQQRFNPGLKFLGMLANEVDVFDADQAEALRDLLHRYPEYMVPTRINHKKAIPEAISQCIPVWQLKKTTAREAAKQMRQAFAVIEERMQS